MALLLWHTQLLTAHADEQFATPVAGQWAVETERSTVAKESVAIFNADGTAAANDETATTVNLSGVNDQVIIDEGDQVAESAAALCNADSVTANEEMPVSVSEVEASESTHEQSILTNAETAADSLVNADAALSLAEQALVMRPSENELMVNQPALATENVNPEQNHLHDDESVNQYRSDIRATENDIIKDDENAMSGNFGVDWHFDASTGTLTLSGGMLNNSYGDNPWRRKSWAPMITRIVIADQIIAGSNMNSLFADLVSVTRYEGLEKLDTSAVTNMQSVFKENSALKKLDLSAWNVDNVTTMVNMFMGNFMGTELTYLNLSGWNTHNVTNMQNMFQYNDQLRTIDGLTDWDTRRVTTMTNMFARSGVRHLNLASFDSASLLEMDGAFSQMLALEDIEFGAQFTVANVTKMNSLFNNDVKLKFLDLSHFNMQNVKANWQMLAGLTSLQTLILGPELDFSQHGTQPLVGLPDIPTNGKYTGKWVNVADASQTFTSVELLARYAGNRAETATFIWEVKSADAITGQDSEIFLNQQWNWSQNVTQLVDQNGQLIDSAALFSANPQAVTVSGDLVDTSKPGTYHVILSYAGRETTVIVTVKDNQSQLNLHAHDVTIEINQETGTAVWHAQDNFDNAMDADGHSVDWQDMTVLGEPDLTRPGTYEVVYQFTDLTGQLVIAVTTVTVVAGADGEAPLPGETTEPEIPEAPEAPEAPESPEVPETPAVSEPGNTEQPDIKDSNDAIGSNASVDNQSEQPKITLRPNYTGNWEQLVTTATSDYLKLNTSERNDGGDDEKQQLAVGITNPAIVTPLYSELASTDGQSSGQLPQTDECDNHLGLMGLMMLMVTGLAGIVSVKRRQG